MENLINSIQIVVKNEFIATKRFLISYWEHQHRYYDDDSGISKNTRVETAKLYYEFSKETSFDEIQKEYKGDFNLCLRAGMKKLYIEAQDFENPFIKIGNLRKIILMRNMLNISNPEYLLYSTKYLINVR